MFVAPQQKLGLLPDRHNEFCAEGSVVSSSVLPPPPPPPHHHHHHRHNLTGDVVTFIHSKGCIGFCIRNIKLAVDQPPLELVEIFATIFCCLKDSSDFSQVCVCVVEGGEETTGVL